MDITLAELEQIINHWRTLRPSRGEERALSTEVDTLATLYALMIFHRHNDLSLDMLAPEARSLIEGWRAQHA